MDAANSSPLFTGTESCLASHRLLNQQRHPRFLGQMQHLEQDCHCLLPAHSERCLQSYSSQKRTSQRHLCTSAGMPGAAHACREPADGQPSPPADLPGDHASLLCRGHTGWSSLQHVTVERRRALWGLGGPPCPEGTWACVAKHSGCQLLLCVTQSMGVLSIQNSC